MLANPDNTDAKNSDVSPTGFGFTNTSWAGQTFTPTVSGQLKRVDVELFCSGCTAARTEHHRSRSGRPPARRRCRPAATWRSATIAGFNDGAAGGLHTFTFATPVTVTAGTRYAFVFRNAATFASGTMAYTCSCVTTGFSNTNPYASGQRVTSSNSGSSWAADTTVGGRDLNFVTYINPGFASSGTFVSSLKDANPTAGAHAELDDALVHGDDSRRAPTSSSRSPASNSQYGPFNFVGPDGTAGTFFTTSGASLSQFNGLRYLRYKAILSTTNGAVTPSLSSVQRLLHRRRRRSSPTSLAVDPATGTFGGTANLSATLTSGGNGLGGGKTVAFTLNGSSVGSAPTNASGVATLSNVSLAGIAVGSYPTGVGASFAGDASFDPSTGSGSLTVNKADQTITNFAPARRQADDRPAVHGQRDRRRLGQRGHVLDGLDGVQRQRHHRHDRVQRHLRDRREPGGRHELQRRAAGHAELLDRQDGTDDHVPGDRRLLVVGRLGDAHARRRAPGSRSATASSPGRAASPAAR